MTRTTRAKAMWAAVWIAALGATYFSAGRYFKRRVEAAGPVPFTLRMEIASPPGHVYYLDTLARRSDGTEVRRGGPAAGPEDNVARTIRFPDGDVLTIFDYIRAKTTWALTPQDRSFFAQRLRERWGVFSQCIVNAGQGKIVGYDSVFGRPAEIVRRDFPGLSQRITSWLVPSLGCVRVAYTIEEAQPDGTFVATTSETPLSLTIGEPDRSMFQVPADYTEMSPSHALEAVFAKRGKPVPAAALAEAHIQDRHWKP